MASNVTMKVLINELLMMYPGQKASSTELTKLWAKFFSHVPDEVLEEAVDSYMEESDYFPTISQIFDKFDAEEYSSELAWELNVSYCHKMATYHGITAGLAMAYSDDPEPEPPTEMIAEMGKLIRWSDVAYSDERNIPFLRKEWMKLYDEKVDEAKSARRKGIRNGDPKYVATLTEQTIPSAELTPEERRRAILAQGLKNVEKSPENGTQGVSEDSVVEVRELTKEEEDAILDGHSIVDAEEIF